MSRFQEKGVMDRQMDILPDDRMIGWTVGWIDGAKFI